MENVNTTSTFEDPYLPENLITHPSSFFRTMLEAENIRSADQFRAEMNRLMDQPFRPDTIFMHPADMEILRQDAERPTSSRALLGMEEIRRAADTWSSERRDTVAALFETPHPPSREVAPLYIAGNPERNYRDIQRTEVTQRVEPLEMSSSPELVNGHTGEIRFGTIAGQLTSYTVTREPAPIYTMSSRPETMLDIERARRRAINTPIIEPATIYEEFQDALDRDCFETLDRIISSNPEEEVYTPYRTRRTGNEPKPAQVLLNDLKNYLQAYHDDTIEAGVVYGALNNIFRTIVEIYGERFLPGEITANSRMTLNAFNAKNLWTLQNKELIIHEANFTTFCQWLHKQQ